MTRATCGSETGRRRYVGALLMALVGLGIALGVSGVPASASVQVDEIPVPAKIVEPGEFAEVFRFQVRDVDPVRNNNDRPTIGCVRIQNIGSAIEGPEVAQVKLVNENNGEEMIRATSAPGQQHQPGGFLSLYCPPRSPANGPVAFEAFFENAGLQNQQSGSEEIFNTVSDVQTGEFGPPTTYSVWVKMGTVSDLRSRALNHTIQLRATIQYDEPLDQDGDGQWDEDPADDDKDGQIDEDPIDGIDNDFDGQVDEDWASGFDDDGDGRIDEDPLDGKDNDMDGLVDEDPPAGKDNDGDGQWDEDPIGTATASVTDSTIDKIQNRGINSHFMLPVSQASLSIPGQTQTSSAQFEPVAKFMICDAEYPVPGGNPTMNDANGADLTIQRVIVKQGASGSATSDDIQDFRLTFVGSGFPPKTAQPLPSSLARSGTGVELPQGGNLNWPITDDGCGTFELSARASFTATRGHTLQPRITVITEENGNTFDEQFGLAPTLESQQLAIIGAGIIQAESRTIPTQGGPYPVAFQTVRFPGGLNSIETQTRSIQFNPDVIEIDRVAGMAGYEVVDVQINPGELRFTLQCPQGETCPDVSGSPQVLTVANIWVRPQPGASPGDLSSLTLQVDKVINSSDEDVTRQVVLSSGSVKLIDPGDINLDGDLDVSDLMQLANTIVEYCLLGQGGIPDDALTDEQKEAADIVQNLIAVPDSAQTAVDTAVNVDVLANDLDPNDAPLLVESIANAPDHGTTSIQNGETITYTPDSGFEGTDSFSYVVSGGNNRTAEGTVTVTVGSNAPNGGGASPDVWCLRLNSQDVRTLAEQIVDQLGDSIGTAQGSLPSSTPWWRTLMNRLLGRTPPTAHLAWTQGRSADRWGLEVTETPSALGGLQGTIRYDPDQLDVQAVEGTNGYEVLAQRINPRKGTIRFVALAPPSSRAAPHEMLTLRARGRLSEMTTSGVEIDIDMLLDADGQRLAYNIATAAAASVTSMQVDRLELAHPTPHAWTLAVQGTGIKRVQVDGFDLSGDRRFAVSRQGSKLEWRTLDEQTGRSLANGVYLYVVTVEGVHGEVWRSDVRKLVVLR